MESLSATFKHEPIDAATDIRLLELHAGCQGDAIRCSLIGVDINKAGEYEALSYAWGSLTDLRVIECDHGALEVTVSLDTALRRLRQLDRPRIMWADAICIDQTNIEERNAQVARMRDIYARATNTIVWLGDDTIHLGDINSYISTAYDMFPPAATAALDSLSGSQQNMAQQVIASTLELLRQGKPNLVDYDWIPLVRLFTRPWFTRRWIIQEVAYSRQLQLVCGRLEISFEKLSTLATWLVYSGISMGIEAMCRQTNAVYFSSFRNFVIIREIRDAIRETSSARPAAASSEGSLVNIISGCRNFMCGDDRDLVFSMLGLATDCVGGAAVSTTSYFPRPDYALTSEQVFTRFALWELVDKQNLDILCLCDGTRLGTVLSSLPSWVPDLRALRNLGHGATDLMEMFHAGGKSRSVVSVVDDRVLEVRGYVVDHIAALVPLSELMTLNEGQNTAPSIQASDRFPDAFPKWLKSCERLAAGGHQHMSSARFEEFWRAMTRDCDAVGKRPPPDLSGAFMAYLRHMDNLSGKHRSEVDAQSVFQHLASVEPQVTRVIGYRFGRTRADRLGQMPRSARLGDAICVFPGARVPYLLRPLRLGTYAVVGECYLNGVMDGQVLASRHFQEQIVTIE
jgi:hypothetical protein